MNELSHDEARVLGALTNEGGFARAGEILATYEEGLAAPIAYPDVHPNVRTKVSAMMHLEWGLAGLAERGLIERRQNAVSTVITFHVTDHGRAVAEGALLT